MKHYKPNSLSLTGAVSLGTGVMIGAGIFALIGQMAELAGAWFPYIFIVGAVVTAFSAYSYIKMSNTYPSAGGIAMYLEKAYGMSWVTGAGALLMAFSMIINESLVARTFASYTVQLFDIAPNSLIIPSLGVALLIFAFLINISGNKVIGKFSFVMAFAKILGISVFGLGGLYYAQPLLETNTSLEVTSPSFVGIIASVALAILAFKGFTTITNSGAEVVDPHRNVSRAIIVSIAICFVVYLLVSFAVSSSLSLSEIIAAKDFALAEAAQPVFGDFGLWFTVFIAIIATISGVIASIFAVSRMLTMLTEMKLIPHRHFGMPGNIQQHLLVYTVVLAILLTLFFDLSRIASLGAIFYLLMDILVHWGVFRYLRQEVRAKAWILLTAIGFDIIILGAFLYIKAATDSLILFVALAMIALIIGGERVFLRLTTGQTEHQHK